MTVQQYVSKDLGVDPTAFFLFEPGGEGIVCERVYFDSNTILRQIGLV